MLFCGLHVSDIVDGKFLSLRSPIAAFVADIVDDIVVSNYTTGRFREAT